MLRLQMMYYFCNFEMFQNLKMFFAILTIVTAYWNFVTATINQDAQGSAFTYVIGDVSY
jgi:hypothetical protein